MSKISFKYQSLDKLLNKSSLDKQGSLVDQVYRVLRQQIINLHLPPQMPLVEKEIADIFAISKTPVREALIRLTNDRLVHVIPKSGSYVTPISLDRYIEANFIRSSLEGSCVKRLAEKGLTPGEQVKLKSIIARQSQALHQDSSSEHSDDIDYSKFFEVDELFHRTLFECAGLLGAWEILNSAKAELDRVRHLKRMMGIQRSSAVLEEHTQIVEAIINRDSDKAEDIIHYHIGSIDNEINEMSENLSFLESVEEFNVLISVQHKSRNRRNSRASKPS